MNACSCKECHWHSDIPNGKIYCYDDGFTHDPQDCCPKYLESCRINPLTGQPYDPQEVPGPEGIDGQR